MTNNKNAPHFILAAVTRIYSELPDLIGDDWPTIQPQVDQHIAALKADPNNYAAMGQLSSLFWSYEAAQQRFKAELKVQEIIQQNIHDGMTQIATDLGFDPATVDGLTAAGFANLHWAFDANTVPSVDDTQTRGITMTAGGVEGGQSVKFTNMHLDVGTFSEIAAGFVTTGFDILDKPHPLLIAAGVLLTVRALHNAMKTELSEQEASVFWSMTQAEEKELTEETIWHSTNREREKYGLPPLEAVQVRQSLTRLETINSIARDGDTYTVIEKYTIKD
jgi:predicted anti-sigma-YlaC factor YlaD